MYLSALELEGVVLGRQAELLEGCVAGQAEPPSGKSLDWSLLLLKKNSEGYLEMMIRMIRDQVVWQNKRANGGPLVQQVVSPRNQFILNTRKLI